MKQVALRPIKIGYGELMIIFYPRMVTVQEQESISNRLIDIADSDADKFQKQWEICKEALETFADKPAEKLVKGKGAFVKLPLEAEFLSERTPINERIIRNAYQMFISELSPTASFLDSGA